MVNTLDYFSRQILDEIHLRGWELYDSTDAHSNSQAEDSIRRGPVSELEKERRYVLLPKTDSPRDPNMVFNSLEKVAIRFSRETPTIQINGERFPWTGFIPYIDCVKVNTPIGHIIPYEKFLSSIKSIIQI